MDVVRLADVERVVIPSDVVIGTLEVLQAYGGRGFEGLVLWLGDVQAGAAYVSRAVVPEQEPISSEAGVGYFVDGDTLFRLNKALALTGLRLIAQVHSHPTEAYHSEADDRYAIVTAEGGFSFVVPNFGKAPVDPSAWAIYRLKGGEWRELNRDQAATTISMSVST